MSNNFDLETASEADKRQFTESTLLMYEEDDRREDICGLVSKASKESQSHVPFSKATSLIKEAYSLGMEAYSREAAIKKGSVDATMREFELKALIEAYKVALEIPGPSVSWFSMLDEAKGRREAELVDILSSINSSNDPDRPF